MSHTCIPCSVCLWYGKYSMQIYLSTFKTFKSQIKENCWQIFVEPLFLSNVHKTHNSKAHIEAHLWQHKPTASEQNFCTLFKFKLHFKNRFECPLIPASWNRCNYNVKLSIGWFRRANKTSSESWEHSATSKYVERQLDQWPSVSHRCSNLDNHYLNLFKSMNETDFMRDVSWSCNGKRPF